MKHELSVINAILSDMDIAPINEQTAREWLIEGGESFEELENMANCYAGEIEQQQVQNGYYSQTVIY